MQGATVRHAYLTFDVDEVDQGDVLADGSAISGEESAITLEIAATTGM